MADLYGTLVGADAYHLERGNAAWTGTDALKDEARLRGSEYVDQHFRSAFPGFKTLLRDQEREWPRSDAVDAEGNWLDHTKVPIEVEYASYEAALRELVSPGSLLPDYNPSGQRKSVKVDVIKIDYSAPHGASSVVPVITVIRGILAPILTSAGSSSIAGKAYRI